MTRPGRFESPRGLRQIARILEVLKQAKDQGVPLSTAEVAVELNVCTENARQYLVHLAGLKVDRQVRITKWQLAGTRYMALYALGSRKNASRPKGKSRAELHRIKRADPVTLALENTYRRNWRRKKRGLAATPAPWFAPLGIGGIAA